jgi:di/tricarboxylate transporter
MEQTIVFAILVLVLVLFIVGRWRYDVVAILALLAVAVTGIVPREQVFAGFGHPAVVTVAAVLVVSRGLQNSGVVDTLARWMFSVGNRPFIQVTSLTGLVGVVSGFMNNVGALALLMPVAIQMARKSNRSPSFLLMPLAFGSLLGGMMTLIGTPPNIIISTFRAETGAEPFHIFDFAPVGIGAALAGVFFISLMGWRLIPSRKGQTSREELFHVGEYMTEVRLPEDSKMVGKFLRDLEEIAEADVTVTGLARGEKRILVPSRYETLRANDIIFVEADPEALRILVDRAGLELVGSKEKGEEVLGSDEVSLIESVVMPDSRIEGRTALSLNLKWLYGVNLLGVARQGERLRQRLGKIRFKPGDILLLQGRTETLQDTLSMLGCLPLAERGLRLAQPRRILLSIGLFGGAIAATVMDLLPVQVAFVAVAAVMILVNLLSIREAYESIDWPVIVLLAAMIPVGHALETTGGAKLLAENLLKASDQISPAATLAIVLLGAMALSNLLNNAATAVLMAPIAISIAQGLGASADPFLMAVAVGSSCAFLTPIGHQSNTLVMGPGGYRFSDYWQMGLPLSIVVVLAAIPLILWFWPLELSTP